MFSGASWSRRCMANEMSRRGVPGTRNRYIPLFSDTSLDDVIALKRRCHALVYEQSDTRCTDGVPLDDHVPNAGSNRRRALDLDMCVLFKTIATNDDCACERWRWPDLASIRVNADRGFLG